MLEINQTCSVDTGCFAGDAAGYPVTINGSAGRSYRLTGDLDLTSTPNTDAIVLQAAVTLDLGGFLIQGPISCTGTGTTLSCGAGAGSGVRFEPSGQASVVRNGMIKGMGGTGVGGDAHQIQIESIRAVNNGRDGVSAQSDAIIRQCTALANGEDGVDVDTGSVVETTVAVGNGNDGIEVDGAGAVVRSTTARGNGGSGFNLAVRARFRASTSHGNMLADNCGGGICSERRRYYLTKTNHNRGAALTACAAGFHMASMLEIRDTTSLAYDTVLGLGADDSGDGPTNRNGYVRTGGFSSGGTTIGTANCTRWSQTSGNGTIAWLGRDWQAAAVAGDPWTGNYVDCLFQTGVWCVESE